MISYKLKLQGCVTKIEPFKIINIPDSFNNIFLDKCVKRGFICIYIYIQTYMSNGGSEIDGFPVPLCWGAISYTEIRRKDPKEYLFPQSV